MSPAPFYIQDIPRRQSQTTGPMLRVEVAYEYVEDVPALFEAAARAEINQEVAVYSTITSNLLCKGRVEAVLHGKASASFHRYCASAPVSTLPGTPANTTAIEAIWRI